MKSVMGNLLQYFAIGTLAGIIAGAIGGGVGSRLAMRITALMTDSRLQGRLTEAQARVGEITAEGTFFLIFFAGILGIYGGLLYCATTRQLGLKTWQKGLLFGCFLLLLHGSFIIEGDNFDFERFGSMAVNLAMFIALPVAFGLLVSYAVAWLEDIYPEPSLNPKSILLHIPAVLGILIFLFLTISAIDSILLPSSSDDLLTFEQAVITSYMLVAIALSLIFENQIRRVPKQVYWQGAVMVIPTLYGGALLFGSIHQIIS